MENLSLEAIMKIFGEFGVVGIVVFMWWYDVKAMRKQSDEHKDEVTAILHGYKTDMADMRGMYERNAHLVERHEELSGDLKDVIIMNTQAMTKLAEHVKSNQFCPMVRLNKEAKGVQK